MPVFAFHVPGVPVPQGSKRAVTNQHTGRAMMIEAGGSRHRDWRARVSSYAMEARNGRPMIAGAVMLNVVFVFARPKAHYGTGKNAKTIKANAPALHAQMPDRDKLLRAVCDSLSGILFADDAQIACGPTRKLWAEGDFEPGAYIVVEPADENAEIELARGVVGDCLMAKVVS